jgi:hypothetical protein
MLCYGARQWIRNGWSIIGSTSLTSTTGAQFNPAITSKKIIDIREANLGFEGTVSTQYRDDAGVGTTIAWPTITAFAAATKTEGNSGADITFTANTESAVTLTINQHQYAAFELEEFEESLSLHDQEMIYQRRSAYAVNLAVDDTLAALIDNFSNAVGTLGVDATDDDVRRSVQYLDDADAPQDGRFFAMAPATKNSMLSIDRYASSDFAARGGANIVSGEFGEIYGLRAWVSTNVEGTNAAGHDNGIYQRDGFALGMRREPRVRKEDDIDNLSTKMAVSAIWGVIETRDR